jgi:hypothetical protein
MRNYLFGLHLLKTNFMKIKSLLIVSTLVAIGFFVFAQTKGTLKDVRDGVAWSVKYSHSIPNLSIFWIGFAVA